jgi:hypothetical protein
MTDQRKPVFYISLSSGNTETVDDPDWDELVDSNTVVVEE